MAETIPTLTYGTVTGRFLAAVADSVDDDDKHPDGVPLSGSVVFTPSAKAILIPGVGTVLPAAIEAPLDAEGYITLNGDRGVELVASDSPAVNPTGFTYAVSFKNLRYGTNNSITYTGFSIAVAAGETTDLSIVAPVPSSGGAPIVRGETGPEGPQGPAGPQGERGLQGVQGIQGVKGDTGSTGPAGTKGDTGSQGIQGVKGDTGATGPKGDQGATGTTGATGPKGDTGAQGPQGDPGATGPKGDTGATGATGPAGSNGVTSVNTRSGAVTLTKSDVGLSNVDNTADTAKPVSSAQQTALNAKVTNGGSVATIVQITQTAYNALATKDANTLYVVVG